MIWGVVMETDFKVFKKIIKKHHQPVGWRCLRGCETCWLIGEVLALNHELERMKRTVKDAREGK